VSDPSNTLRLVPPIPTRPAWQRRVNAKTRALSVRDGWDCAYCTHPLVNPEDDSHWKWDGGGDYILCPTGEHYSNCTHPEGYWSIAHRAVTSGIVEHVIPRAHGGGNDLANLVLACDRCNSAKASKLLPNLPLGWWVHTFRDSRAWTETEILEQHEQIQHIWERAVAHQLARLDAQIKALTTTGGAR
jgi:5-methylcytosine-specific restriction endonuclease McrA